ncbi:MAG: hypothetical protein ACYS7Y_36815 [Planctomycetota bacterium]|jgi:hypothetical protein
MAKSKWKPEKHGHGTYIGSLDRLKGETAILVVSHREGKVLAQFDSLNLGLALTHAWPEFSITDFEIDPANRLER